MPNAEIRVSFFHLCCPHPKASAPHQVSIRSSSILLPSLAALFFSQPANLDHRVLFMSVVPWQYRVLPTFFLIRPSTQPTPHTLMCFPLGPWPLCGICCSSIISVMSFMFVVLACFAGCSFTVTPTVRYIDSGHANFVMLQLLSSQAGIVFGLLNHQEWSDFTWGTIEIKLFAA